MSIEQVSSVTRRAGRSILAALVIATALALLTTGCSAGYAGGAPIIYMPASSDTTIAPVQSSAESRIDIYSESGIGSAVFLLLGGAPPDDLTLRLHLQGLEQLTFAFGEHAIHASVSSHGAQTVREALVTAEEAETPITPDSPFWVDIAPSDSVNGRPVYYDVRPPAAFYDGLRIFRLQWIDFYR